MEEEKENKISADSMLPQETANSAVDRKAMIGNSKRQTTGGGGKNRRKS